MSSAANDVKYWAVHYDYVADAWEKRAPHRSAHLELANKAKDQGKLLMGGAYTDEPKGALLTFHATRDEVESFVKNDPYVANGVVTKHAIREWTVVVGGKSAVATVKVGDALPEGLTLVDGSMNKVNVNERVKGKKVVIFGVPGAFTPGCSKTHLPGYVSDAEKLKSKGIDEIICISVNDPFVHAAWGTSAGTEGKVTMLADPAAAFVSRLGLDIDLTGMLGSVRSKRFSMVVEDGKVTQLNLEPASAPTGLTCSLASALKL